jgi:hypothetical protein
MEVSSSKGCVSLIMMLNMMTPFQILASLHDSIFLSFRYFLHWLLFPIDNSNSPPDVSQSH